MNKQFSFKSVMKKWDNKAIFYFNIGQILRFCLLYIDFLQKQVPINFVQYCEFSGTLFKSFCLDAKLPDILSITLAQVFGHKQNEFLKTSWLSLRMTEIGFIFCSTPGCQCQPLVLRVLTSTDSV